MTLMLTVMNFRTAEKASIFFTGRATVSLSTRTLMRELLSKLLNK